jgi:3-oxoacyl-[acyl-carrier protein] reductase
MHSALTSTSNIEMRVKIPGIRGDLERGQETGVELLKDKVAIVTGAGAGIGAGVAELFCQEGAHVFLTDIDSASVHARAAALEPATGTAAAFAADVRDREAMNAVVEAAVSQFGRIDILINNAGVYPRQPFIDMTESQWDTIQDINLKGTFHCAQLVVPHMMRQKEGAIVNISSVTFFVGMKNLTHYIASKGGVIGFTRSLARELGEHNIRVNCISPGAVETEGEKAVATAEQIAAILDLQSLRRRILPIDIARTCLFLAGPLGSGLTGQTINVDGGWIMH